jgi:hypothetical protein
MWRHVLLCIKLVDSTNYSYLCIMKKYMYNRRLIAYKCDNCSNEAKKPLSEYNRNIKLSRKNYCCRKCAAEGSGNLLKGGSTYDISQHSINKRDEYTPFRSYLRKCNRRFKEVSITIEDVKKQWELQDGICPYSGVKLLLKKSPSAIFSPSIDRIDSSKGYIPGNIQFTSQAINFMKGTMTHEQTMQLCSYIAAHN